MKTRDPTTIGRLTVVRIRPWLAANLGVGAAALRTIQVLGGFGGPVASMPVLRATDGLTAVAGRLLILMLVMCAIVFLRWTYIVSANAWAITAAPLDITPGRAVGWYVVPFANLLRPSEALRETWQASFDPPAPGDVATPMRLRVWWAAWILSGLTGDIAVLTLRRRTIEIVVTRHFFDVAAVLLHVVTAVALAGIVTRLTDRQSAILSTAPDPDVPDPDAMARGAG